jgi:hypothetical protein
MSEKKSYNFQLEQINGKHLYSFDGDIKKYQIIISPYLMEDGYYKIAIVELSQDVKINKNIYKVKSALKELIGMLKITIIDIINDFTLKNKLKGFVFSLYGSKEKKIQREKIYQFFLEKYQPNFKFEKSGDIYYINI